MSASDPKPQPQDTTGNHDRKAEAIAKAEAAHK